MDHRRQFGAAISHAASRNIPSSQSKGRGGVLLGLLHLPQELPDVLEGGDRKHLHRLHALCRHRVPSCPWLDLVGTELKP